MTAKIFKEPEGGRRAWVFILIACYSVVETLFFRESLPDRLAYLTFGLAELVPRTRTELAGALRIGGVALVA
jgi:hypothetical protein